MDSQLIWGFSESGESEFAFKPSPRSGQQLNRWLEIHPMQVTTCSLLCPSVLLTQSPLWVANISGGWRSVQGGVCMKRTVHRAWYPFKLDVWFDWKLSFGLRLLVGFCLGRHTSGTFAGRKGNLFGIEIWFFQCLHPLRLCSSGANFINPKWLIKAKWRHFSKHLRVILPVTQRNVCSWVFILEAESF